jgi:hypothetical protein
MIINKLNISGHTKLTFEIDNDESRNAAKEQVNDLLKNGWSLYTNVDGEQREVKGFDEVTTSLVISNKRGTPKGTPEEKVPAKDAEVTSTPPSARGCEVKEL